MIKVDFWGIDFYPTGYKNENLIEGRLIPENDYIVPVSTTWKNEQYPIQSIIYPQKYFKVYQKETFFTGFEKIKSAGTIQITYNGEILGYKLIDYEDNNIVDSLGFKEVIVHVADIYNYKTTIIYNNLAIKGTFKIYDLNNTLLFSHNLRLVPLSIVDFTQNEVDNFKEKVTDYTKINSGYNIRMVLSTSDLSNLYTYLSEVSINPIKNYIKLTGTGISVLNGRQYEIIGQSEIGTDLYQVDLKIITTNSIATQWN